MRAGAANSSPELLPPFIQTIVGSAQVDGTIDFVTGGVLTTSSTDELFMSVTGVIDVDGGTLNVNFDGTRACAGARGVCLRFTMATFVAVWNLCVRLCLVSACHTPPSPSPCHIVYSVDGFGGRGWNHWLRHCQLCWRHRSPCSGRSVRGMVSSGMLLECCWNGVAHDFHTSPSTLLCVADLHRYVVTV